MPRFPADDLYARLGVPSTADVKEIHKAWRAKMRDLHPDRRPGDLAAHAESVRLNEAHDILTNRYRRAEYDRYRRAQRRGQTGRGTNDPREPHEPPPPPPPPPSPPPSPPRVVLEPPEVDFGTVQWGDGPADQRLTIRMSDGSPLPRVAVRHHFGRFWTNRQYEEVLGRREFTVVFAGRNNANLGPGPRIDVAEIAVGDQLFVVKLRITIEGPAGTKSRSEPPPWPPRQAPADPSHEREQASASAGDIPPPRSSTSKHPLVLLLLVLAVLIGAGAWATTNVLGKGSPPRATTAPKSSPYCAVTSDQGVMAFFRVVPGTERATGPELWDSMAAPTSDPWVTWWTPQFQYWERANRTAGYQDDTGATYGQYADLQVSIIWEQGWEPLSGMIQRHPKVNGEAEATMRKRFLGAWVQYLGSPSCT